MSDKYDITFHFPYASKTITVEGTDGLKRLNERIGNTKTSYPFTWVAGELGSGETELQLNLNMVTFVEINKQRSF